jgi:molybdenum cofactor cytidylyltransferase
MQTAAADIPVLVLAAGASQRLGRPKQQVVFNGSALLVNTVAQARQSGRRVYVALGSNAAQHQPLLPPEMAEVWVNPGWQLGMGHTLKFGLAALLRAHPVLDAVIVSVCDQPYLTAAVFQQLANAYHPARRPLVACRYAVGEGVPALFGRAYFDELLALPDDAGAKKILQRHAGRAGWVSFPQGHIDIDTPDDLAALIKS